MLTRFARFNSLVLAALLAVGGGGEPDAAVRTDAVAFDLAAARATIAQHNKRFTDAHVSGDVATIDAFFLPDARSYPPGAAAAIGIDAIHALTVDYLKSGITEFREETTAFSGSAELVVDEGTYVLTYGQGVAERGKYINVWKQVNGEWRIQANIWNADPAPATPK
jgi:ketosteroid isomerase-like protein